MSRRPRQRRRRGAPRTSGSGYEVEVGPVAHGGHCVARVSTDDRADRVVFVRHALPGERVVVEVTEGTDGDRFWRGDAVEVLTAVARPGRGAVPATPDRGRCGGCDFQHVDAAAQRALKAAVVARAAARGWPGSTVTSWSRRCRRRGCAGAPGCATSHSPTAAAGCACTAPTRWSRSTTA